MSPHQLILENSFWKFLVSVEELKDRKEIVLLCSSLSINEEQLKAYCEFLTKFEINILLDDNFVYPLKDHCRVKVEFSLSEWLSLEANIAANQDKNDPIYFQLILENKFKTLQKTIGRPSIFQTDTMLSRAGTIRTKSGEFNRCLSLEKRIDHHICHKKLMKLSFTNANECEILPHRQVYLDGVLCVVGESIKDKALCYFSVEKISEIEDCLINYEANLSQIEINEFIGHLRLVNGKEERLVLKIYSQEEAELLPQHHYLGNPFITSNTEGDMIWAATIEMCDDVFQWLYKMKDRVEILDPGHVRKEFAHYCELRKESSESSEGKKAS